MREACGAEISAVGVDGYALQVDVGLHRCEADIAEPTRDKILVQPIWTPRLGQSVGPTTAL